MVMKSCSNCGFTRNTNPAADLCTHCEKQRRLAFFTAKWMKQIDELGFDQVDCTITNNNNHSMVTVKNRDCGHTFTAKLNNIIARKTACGVCGPTKRAANALKHYIEKHGRTYDITVWNDYKREVWLLTNNFYKENKHKLNPMGFPRKKAGTHPDAVNLDHIIPMIYCFKNSLPVELAADPMNIQIIPAADNLSKKQKLTEESNNLLKLLKTKHSVI